MHSLSVRSESPEVLLPPEVIPEVMPAIGRTLMFEPEPDDLRVDGVRVVDVDHEDPEEPDELCDDEDEELDDREVL